MNNVVNEHKQYWDKGQVFLNSTRGVDVFRLKYPFCGPPS